MAQIHADVTFVGGRGAQASDTVSCLVDTGAEASLMPRLLAGQIGAWKTNLRTKVAGVYGPAREVDLVAADIAIPAVSNRGGRFLFVLDDTGHEPILGLDILKALGITIDAATHQLTQKNELWEAFKTVTGYGTVFYVGAKLFDAMTADPPRPRSPKPKQKPKRGTAKRSPRSPRTRQRGRRQR